ncbi:hypothetical protein EHR01_12320 [Leptospira mtsangambouensis]|uniref:Uncharacterized protein n=1 Tax=Leptospira mtsangambouensis TaxID=2484912 RepID=A0ABY2NYR9_9LEPT|nr:hypothetical protein [Leptospira mtsangambouensis]TGM74280.1 hypothetical protein EHR01_12320 [Leptospira mtsangambouensis]
MTDHKLGKDLSINLEDRNVFVSNEKDELFPDTEYFIPPNLITKIEYGITEDQLYKLIGNKYFRERFSFNRVLPKRISYLNYIPIDKMVNFNGGNSTIIRNSNSISYHTSERMTAAFYFYKNRLIYKTIIHTDNIGGKTIFLPLTSKEVLKAQPYTPKSLDTTNEISGMNYWHDAKYYGFVNGYLIENINAEGKKYYSSNVIVGKHLHKKDFFTRNYCMLYAYWEFPDFESDLEKSDYHKFKAKIDLDFEKKTGYWSERVNN